MKNKNEKHYAAIDLGTNSCRLVIADAKGNYVYKDAVATKLGEGMFQQKLLTEEAMKRSLECFYNFKQKIDEYWIDSANVRAIATAACRMSSNSEEFINKVYHETLIKLNVIDGYEEARLNLIGAKDNIKNSAENILLIDLGGGSTEISLAKNTKNPQVVFTLSIPWGARNSHEAFGLTEYDEEKAGKLRKEIQRWVDGFINESHLDNYRENLAVIATSSTPLRLASMVKQFGKYEREQADGITVKTSEANACIERLYKMSREEMAADQYIGEKRSFIFIAASVIFKTITDGLGVEKFTSSLKSAKDGLIKEMIENDKANQVCQSNIRTTGIDR